MRKIGIPIAGIKLKGTKIETVRRYHNASQAIAAKKRPKQTWRKT